MVEYTIELANDFKYIGEPGIVTQEYDIKITRKGCLITAVFPPTKVENPKSTLMSKTGIPEGFRPKHKLRDKGLVIHSSGRWEIKSKTGLLEPVTVTYEIKCKHKCRHTKDH